MRELYRVIADIMDISDIFTEAESSLELEPVKPGEEVVGEVSPGLRKLFIGISHMKEEIREITKNANQQGSLDTRACFKYEDLASEIAEKESTVALAEAIFWHEVQASLKLWRHKGRLIALREDWRVVLYKERRNDLLGSTFIMNGPKGLMPN